MELKHILTADRTLCHAQTVSKKSLLELVSKTLAEQVPSLNYSDILTKLAERERLGSTGIGYGVAIPHARMGALAAPIASLIHLDQGVDFGSSDEQPVDLVFGFIVPEGLDEEHLALISALATAFNEPDFREKLRNAKTNKELHHTMVSINQEEFHD